MVNSDYFRPIAFLRAKMQPKKIVSFSNPYRAFCVPRGLPSRPACQVAQRQWQEAVKGDQKLSKNLHKSAGIYPKRQHFIWKNQNDFLKIFWCQLNLEIRFLPHSYHSVLFKSNFRSHNGNLVFKTHLELNEYSLDKIILDGNIHITLHIQTVTTQCKVTLKVVLYKKCVHDVSVEHQCQCVICTNIFGLQRDPIWGIGFSW